VKQVLTICTFLLTLGAGCVHDSQPAKHAMIAAPLPARDAAVLEAALRDRLRGGDPGETVFISLGSIDTAWKVPPPDFLARLQDLPGCFKPISMARLPKGGEMETPNRYRGVEDPVTGKRSWIYWAEIKEWVSETKVRVDVGGWSGPLTGGGGIFVFELQDGRWVFTELEDGWMS
jgi:hypothetical protein